MPEDAEAAPAPQQDVAQATDTRADATATAKASDELSEDDLEAVAGGVMPKCLTRARRPTPSGGPGDGPSEGNDHILFA